MCYSAIRLAWKRVILRLAKRAEGSHAAALRDDRSRHSISRAAVRSFTVCAAQDDRLGAGGLTAEQFCLRSDRRFQSELPVRIWQRYAPLWRPLDVAFHDQVRLVHFLERSGFFADGDG